MKVLTLTTQYANNYGALLQCYALSKYLNNQEGISCEVINYLPDNYKESWSIIRRPKSFKDLIKILYSLTQVKFIKEKKAKNKLMMNFVQKYIPLTSKRFRRRDIINNPPVADVYICGSDQIWNQIIFKDLTYFLDFVPSGKRISYAASMADPWEKDFEEFVTPSLNLFDGISMREKGNIPQAQKLVKEKEIKWVIDPVFLLGKNGWNEIATEPEIREPYIFCYFLNVSSFAVEVVTQLRKMTGLKVVNLSVDVLDKFSSDILIRRADPCDFVGLIKNAEYVCTNSFHCSAFSIIFEKKFSFIPKTWANERVISLEEIFGIDVIMSKEKLEHLSPSMWATDYEKGKNGGEAFIQSSRDFLKKAIYG